jgi:hypothetical protein
MPPLPLNGSDQLMRSFDYELRRAGFAGNQCQIVLELASTISPELLQKRLSAFQSEFPILNARVRKIFRPHWNIPQIAKQPIPVRLHPDEPGLRQRLLNQPLRIHGGELMRFDLISGSAGVSPASKMILLFTWTHLLMDATSAEHFLAALSDPNVALPKTNPQPAGAPTKWPDRLTLMKKSVEQLDAFCERQPRALKTRHPAAQRQLQYRVEQFSAAETARIRANATTLCGALGDAQFHAVSAALELHCLHEQLGCPTESYILPMPVGLRPKGRIEPLFSNQVDMLMLQFLPEDLESAEKAAAALKGQAMKALRENSLSYGRKLAELFSFLPMPIFMAVLKHGLKGEICSLFFGDTAAVNPALEAFLGVPVENFTHIAAVTPSPGLGVIFYYFRGELRLTIVHAAPVLTESEAAAFSSALRHRLLNP